MKFLKRKWVSGVFLAGAVLAGWYFFRAAREPTYEGRALSSWFREYCNRQPPDSCEALLAIGTNAVPFLLEKAFDPSQDLGSRVVADFLNRIFHWNTHLVSADERRSYAGLALKQLQPPAALMMPALKNYLQGRNRLGHNQALYLLGTIGEGGEEGVPYLIEAVKGRDRLGRMLALQGLGWLGPKAKEAVSTLTEILKGPAGTNYPVSMAVIALGKIGSNAAPAAPVLNSLFEQRTDLADKTSTAIALLQIDEGQRAAYDFLFGLLTNANTPDKLSAAIAHLADVGPNAKEAAPALLERIENAQGLEFLSASLALKKMGVPPATICAGLKKQLRSMDEWTRVNAALATLQIDPADHEAHLVALEVVRSGSDHSGTAVEALGRAGAAAKEVLPGLREMLDKVPKGVREKILQAIKRIERER